MGATASLQCDAEYYATEQEELRCLPVPTSDFPQWLPLNTSARCLPLSGEDEPLSGGDGPRRRLLQTQNGGPWSRRNYQNYGYYPNDYYYVNEYDVDVYYPYRNSYLTGYSWYYWGQRWGSGVNQVTPTSSLTISPCDPYTICLDWTLSAVSGIMVVQARLLFPTAGDFAQVASDEFYSYGSLDVTNQQAIVNITEGKVNMAADPAGQIEGTQWALSLSVCQDSLTTVSASTIMTHLNTFGTQPYTYYLVLYKDFCLAAVNGNLDLIACTGEASQLWAFMNNRGGVVTSGAMYNKLMSMCWYNNFYPCNTQDSMAWDNNVALTSSGYIEWGELGSGNTYYNLQPWSGQRPLSLSSSEPTLGQPL
jgi:hypothetical protein